MDTGLLHKCLYATKIIQTMAASFLQVVLLFVVNEVKVALYFSWRIPHIHPFNKRYRMSLSVWSLHTCLHAFSLGCPVS